ncbi:unnamed protein product [Paramecium pentaurelia]|uniref:TNFR-Cys domain-containing protein n=1 Tax=Paramecium pentaurelia TaxID=43138 RepID=A0A8S1XJS3_9CILI|nr:unnamed protein product [Paramecium pentaurelia]
MLKCRHCTSCKLLRLLNNNQCNCIDGAYESGNDKQCLLCNKTCETCINQENYCTSCSANKIQIFKTGNICICQDGYYKESITLSCKKCNQSFLTCKVSPNYCLMYDAFYNLSLDVSNRCVCSTDFYLNIYLLQNVKVQQQQFSLQYFMQTMQNIDAIYFDSDNLRCPCKDGYYEAQLNKFSTYYLSCKTCINQSTKCLSCESTYFRILNNSNQCICLDGYDDIGIEMCQQCNLYCKTCQIISTKCTSCNQTQHFRLLNKNQCICQNGYYKNNSSICEQCSYLCLTCEGRRDYCKSYDLNQNRIDQSVINKCSCSNGFYSDENENCQKCHPKCQTCNQSKENCITCSYSKISNRQSICQNCICKDGYFDDGIQWIVKNVVQVASFVKILRLIVQLVLAIREIHLLFVIANLNFLKIFFRIVNPVKINVQLVKRHLQIVYHVKKQDPPNFVYVKMGIMKVDSLYYDFQCKTCKDSSVNCLCCKGDRINIPRCGCPYGFYDDLLNVFCQVCDGLCKKCNLDGCLSYNGIRILSPEMSCDQPQNSVSHPDTAWCSTCEVAVVDVRFSDDLLSISVKFAFPLNPSFFTTQIQDNICLKILDFQTYQLLGKNPICYVDPDDDTKLIKKVGQQVMIIPGDKIIFYDNYFGHQECEKQLDIFIYNEIKNPINPVSPRIIYDLSIYLLNPCDYNIKSMKSKLNDGLRGFIGIKWTYSVDGFNGNGDLDNFVASLTSLQMLELVIPYQTVSKQSDITLYIKFQNFVGSKTIQMIKLQTHSGQFPTILWISKPYYQAFQTVVLQFLIEKKDCSESVITQINNSQYQLSLVQYIEIILNQGLQEQIIKKQHAKVSQCSGLHIPSNKQRLILCLTFQLQEILHLKLAQELYFVNLMGQKKDLELLKRNLYIYYVEIQILNMTGIRIQAYKLLLDSSGFKNQFTYKFKQNIAYLDNDFELLNVTYSQGYLMRPVKNYKNLEFTFNIPFQDRQYLFEYQEFIKKKQINLKFLAQFTNEIIPNQADLQLIVNSPPTCLVSLSELTVEALRPLKIITICDFSYAAPFTYQLRYILINQDLIDFFNSKSDYSLILSSYQRANILEGYFPQGDGILKDHTQTLRNRQMQLRFFLIVLRQQQINIILNNKFLYYQKFY